MKKGIDVSKHQGVIDWKKVAADGVEFAILRAGYGMYESQVDPQFARNVKGATKAGIPIGAYWYSYAVTVENAVKEADCFLKTIRGIQFDYPLFFDQEYEPGIKALNKDTRTAICKAFIARVTEAGYNCGIYASKDWLENWINPEALGKLSFWVAQYGDKLTYKKGCNIWQYTDKGKINGISGNVDMNYCYTEYGEGDNVDSGKYVTASGHWQEIEKGRWKFVTNDGSDTGGKWLKSDGRWYFFAPDGIAVKGEQTINGKPYYFKETPGNLLKECQMVQTNENGALI